MKSSYNIFWLPVDLPDGYLFYYIEEKLNKEKYELLRNLLEDE